MHFEASRLFIGGWLLYIYEGLCFMQVSVFHFLQCLNVLTMGMDDAII
jgi:hypothetical protein